jgi:deazaflavin-dependent oxidoreductase (nitroreductase family)
MPAREPRPYTEREIRIARPVMRAMSRANVWVYRLSGGRVGGRWLRGAPVCLLTSIGRRSGEPRTTPLLYLEDGERLLLVASQGGMPMHPVWYRNLEAQPECEIQIASAVRKMRARRASDAEKRSYWPRLTSMYRDFDDYQARTERDIPVVILEPR